MTRQTPHPFLKRAGGKGSQAADIAAQMPQRIEAYAEPFLGGGAVFWHLARAGRLAGPVLLSDADRDLVELWQVVRDDPEGLLRLCAEWTTDYRGDPEGVFYFVRGKPKAGTPLPTKRWKPRTKLERAARMLWLNRFCVNGLWRKNAAGEFNVGWCRDPKRNGIDAANLRRCSEMLRELDVTIRCMPVADAWVDIPRGATVYLDPPYDGVDFDGYGVGSFSGDAQSRLAVNADRGAATRFECVVASNSDTEAIRAAYGSGFARTTIDRVMVARSINSKGDGRGKVPEVRIVMRPAVQLFAGWDSSPTHSALVVEDADGDVVYQRQLTTLASEVRPPFVQRCPFGPADGPRRLAWLARWYREAVEGLAGRFPHDQVFCIVEDYALTPGRKGKDGKRVQNNQGKALTFECGGLLRAAIASAGWRLRFVTPGKVKKHATGSGGAMVDKEQVADGARARWGWGYSRELKHWDDATDARVMANLARELRQLQTGALSLESLPKAHREVYTGTGTKARRRNLIEEGWL